MNLMICTYVKKKTILVQQDAIVHSELISADNVVILDTLWHD